MRNIVRAIGVATVACFSVLIAGPVWAESTLPYQDASVSVEERVADLLGRMTLEEKAALTAGTNKTADGLRSGADGTRGIAVSTVSQGQKMTLPQLLISHGPYGFRGRYAGADGRTKVQHGTAFPASVNQACTWDPELMGEICMAMGNEMKAYGFHANAGPAMNIIRDPSNGRAMEYFTEDPYLNSMLTAHYIKGLQKTGVLAIPKHFVANNTERCRGFIDVEVDKRALHEIYFPAFQASVDAGAIMMMNAYNKVNGTFCSQNRYLLTDILRDKWGFDGMVISDWGSTHSTDAAAAGLDLEMPSEKFMGKALLEKEVDPNVIDKMARRILKVMFVAGCFDEMERPPKSIVKSAEHIALAKQAADEGIVLLKNDGILPLDKSKIKSIAVIGPNGEFGEHYNNGKYGLQLFNADGSANVDPGKEFTITPFAGLKDRAGEKISVRFAAGAFAETGCARVRSEHLKSLDGQSGLSAEYFSNSSFEGTPKKTLDPTVDFRWTQLPDVWIREDVSFKKGFSVRWSGTLEVPETRDYLLELLVDGHAKLTIDDQLLIDWETSYRIDIEKYTSVPLTKGSHTIRLEYQKTQNTAECRLRWDYDNLQYLKEAKALASESDVVVLACGGSGNIEREGRDRSQLELFPPLENLIQEISKVNPNTIVVLYGNFFVMQNWIDQVPAILEAGFPGQQGGNAIADILFGTVNPSGKLTVTYPVSTAQYPEGFTQSGVSTKISYPESIYVGYRYFEKEGKKPQFPFGFGLSYTSFDFNNLKVASVDDDFQVTLDITNSGGWEGTEVVQLYIHDVKASVDRPVKELKGFQRVQLKPGETKAVQFQITPRDLAYYDEAMDKFIAEAGQFEARVGSSSADIKLNGAFELIKTHSFKK